MGSVESLIEDKKSEVSLEVSKCKSRAAAVDRELRRRRREASATRTEAERKELAKQIVVLEDRKLFFMRRQTQFEMRLSDLERLQSANSQSSLDAFLEDTEALVDEPEPDAEPDASRVDEMYTRMFTDEMTGRLLALRDPLDRGTEERFTNI